MINEGSSGKVFAYGEDSVVKVGKRGVRGNLSIREQYKMHAHVWSVLNFGEYNMLYTPKPLACAGNSYRMERIDDSVMITGAELSAWPMLVEELSRFYEYMKTYGVYPNDYELYLQKNGQVALIDFDKFIRL